MKIIYLVLLLLLGIAGITVFVLLSEPPIGAVGIAHQTIAGMSVGGDGAARLATIGRAPYYFQALLILVSGLILYMGIAPHRRDRLCAFVVSFITALVLYAWHQLYTGYEAYLMTGEAQIVAGFPAPTNWMLWGVWGGSLLYIVFYVVAFRRYFLPAEDEAAFRALVEECKTEKGAA